MTDDPRARIRAVLAIAARLADGAHPLGRAAREALHASSGLSPQGVELGLTQHLERGATEEELASLLAWAGSAPRVHVVLAANVFVGAVRALALALAAAPSVRVRPSTRDPSLAPLLVGALAPLDVALVADLSGVAPGDHVHVYGRDETVATVTAKVPDGVLVRGHGTGMGVAVVDGAGGADVALAAERLSWDVAPFDQRGCLSPRVVLAAPAIAARFAAELAGALARREEEVPRGALSDDERAAVSAWRATLEVAGELEGRGAWSVGLLAAPRALAVPPPGRHVLVAATSPEDVPRLFERLSRFVAAIGTTGESALASAVARAAAGARRSPLGDMQRPPLDGPVDRRGT